MARSSAGRPKAGKPGPDASSLDKSASGAQEVTSTDPDAADLDSVDADDLAGSSAELADDDPSEVDIDAADEDGVGIDEDDAEFDEEGEIVRSRQTDEFWAKIKIEPVEIALPGGVGYTLRAYRMNTEVTPTDYTAREQDEFPDRTATYAVDDDEEFLDPELDDEEALDTDDVDDDLEVDDSDDDEAVEEDDDVEEEVPLFLTQTGRLPLFHTRSGLVEFVRSDAEHDLTQLKGWTKFAGQLRPEHVVPLPDDSYELDLIVKNLRSGHDTWDPELIVQSGQVARDIGHALHIEPIVMAMSPGSPLDDLDDALRAVAVGGVGTFFARRKAKKIGSETAAIGWRTVIGKISAVVDWRD